MIPDVVSMPNPIVPFPDQGFALWLSFLIELVITELLFLFLYGRYIRTPGKRRSVVAAQSILLFFMLFLIVYIASNLTVVVLVIIEHLI